MSIRVEQMRALSPTAYLRVMCGALRAGFKSSQACRGEVLLSVTLFSHQK